MELPPPANPAATGNPTCWWKRLLRAIGTLCIALFVCWHLFVLIVRNPLDLAYQPIKNWAAEYPGWNWDKIKPTFEAIDDATYRYANLTGAEQGWVMFSQPLARSAPYLAARLEFADGSTELLFSPNEFDPDWFFRVGGWRQRKLEDQLVWTAPDELSDSEDLPLFQAYVRWSVQRWRAEQPDDARELKQVVLLRRRLEFPPPDETHEYHEPDTILVGTFAPDGRLLGGN